MVKAILSHGEIRSLEPLPADWREGQELCVDRADENDPTIEEIERDFAVLSSLCAHSDSSDEIRMDQALDEARRQAKDQVRRSMGLV